MTEKEAWLFIAARLKEAVQDGTDDFVITSKRGSMFPCDGLCDAVTAMGVSAHIDSDIVEAMRKKIKAHAPVHGHGYAWPLGRHFVRKEFCIKMAELCEKGECDGK